jgi:hypothetical protein
MTNATLWRFQIFSAQCATASGARERTNQTSSNLYMRLLSIHVTLHSSVLLYCRRAGKLIKALASIQSLVKLSDFPCDDIVTPHFKNTSYLYCYWLYYHVHLAKRPPELEISNLYNYTSNHCTRLDKGRTSVLIRPTIYNFRSSRDEMCSFNVWIPFITTKMKLKIIFGLFSVFFYKISLMQLT